MKKKLACLLALALAPASAFAHPPDAGAVETVVQFSSAQLETPESIGLDVEGNLYISLAIAGEIRKIAPDGTQSTLAVLPIGPILTFGPHDEPGELTVYATLPRARA